MITGKKRGRLIGVTIPGKCMYNTGIIVSAIRWQLLLDDDIVIPSVQKAPD